MTCYLPNQQYAGVQVIKEWECGYLVLTLQQGDQSIRVPYDWLSQIELGVDSWHQDEGSFWVPLSCEGACASWGGEYAT